MKPYEISWEINPDQEASGDLHFDDRHVGYRDCSAGLFPTHPFNRAYMEGWLCCLGMEAGYANVLPVSDDTEYMDGYEEAQGERLCHSPEQPDIRSVQSGNRKGSDKT